jgi:hypothetical protein
MNKDFTFIAVLVVIFVFSIQFLVFEIYPSRGNEDDNNHNNNIEIDSETCNRLFDSKICKQIQEGKIKLNTNELAKGELTNEEIQSEEIIKKYLESPDPNQNTLNILGQMRNKIIESENQAPLNPYTNPPGPSVTNPPGPSVTNPPGPSVTNPPGPSVTNPPGPSVTNPPGPSSSTPLLTIENLNILDQSQLIDAISSKISQIRTFDKNKLSQALFDLTQATAAKGGDVMKNLRQIGTKILQNPSDPLIDRIIGLAQTK